MLALGRGGHVVLGRRVENQAIEHNGGFSPSMGLSVHRRSKHAKDNAQDCKTLHRSSPFLSVCIQRIYQQPQRCRFGANGHLGTSPLFSGVKNQHVNFRTNGKESFRKIRRVVYVPSPCDARERLQEFFARRGDSYGLFTSAFNQPNNSWVEARLCRPAK
jgi:hypothetical protein